MWGKTYNLVIIKTGAGEKFRHRWISLPKKGWKVPKSASMCDGSEAKAETRPSSSAIPIKTQVPISQVSLLSPKNYAFWRCLLTFSLHLFFVLWVYISLFLESWSKSGTVLKKRLRSSVEVTISNFHIYIYIAWNFSLFTFPYQSCLLHIFSLLLWW